jgi:hypothetical protein
MAGWPYEKNDFVDIIIIMLYQIYTRQTCAHILYQIHFVFQVDYQPFSKTQCVKCFFYMCPPQRAGYHLVRLDPILHKSKKWIFLKQDERFAIFIDYEKERCPVNGTTGRNPVQRPPQRAHNHSVEGKHRCQHHRSFLVRCDGRERDRGSFGWEDDFASREAG